MDSMEIASLFEYVQRAGHGFVPKRVDPKRQGIAARFFYSLAEGIFVRRGGKLRLFAEDNARHGELQMQDGDLVVRILGVPVLSISKERIRADVVQVGQYLEMFSEGEKVYVWVTQSGRLSVRKTPPPVRQP